MSSALPTIDVSGGVVGTEYTIDLKASGYTSDPSFYAKPARLRIQNESACGFYAYTLIEGHSFYIAAGQWPVIDLTPGESGIRLKINYIIAGNSPFVVLPTFYRPGEVVDDAGTLGNSPTTGAISLMTNTTLSNEGNAPGSLVIDAGTGTNPQLIKIFNDHVVEKVEQSGVAHTVITTQTAGIPLVLGQAGDTTKVAGALTIGTNGFVANAIAFGFVSVGAGFTFTITHNLGIVPLSVVATGSAGAGSGTGG